MKRSPKTSRKRQLFAARRPLWQAYLFAIAATVATLLFRKGLGVTFGERPLLILFMFPAILSASLGGLGPGLLSTILSTAIVSFYLIPPTGSFAIAKEHDAVQLFMLFTNGVLVSFLSEALHRFRVNAENRMQDLNYANRQMEEEISGRKRVEEQLRLSNAYNRSLIEASLDPMVTIGHDGRITDVNSATERMTGYPREDLIGEDFSAYFNDPAKAEAGYQMVFREGSIHDYELEIRHRDGHITPVLYNASIYRDETGKIAGAFAAARDISERKELESQLRQSHKMEAIGTLAGGVAHEFNNIMTAVIGYGSILKLKLSNDATLLSKVDALLQTAERAAVLVRSLLSFSRKQGCELKYLDLNELITREGKLLLSVIRENIELKVSLTDGLLPVKADNSQIEQVLVNLMKNAQDAMPNGGEININTASVELDGQFHEIHGFGEPGWYAVITFSDSGGGIGEDIRQKIFEPFFTTKEVGKGTGLGLSICYGIIKQHNGYIVCESEPGKGTTFSIYLPMIATEPEKSESIAAGPIKAGTETILIAEDDEDVREVAREVLEEYGYKVIEATDGEDALGKFKNGRDEIALVIIDVIMPRMNGRELYLEISRLDPGMKVIFYSGHTADVLPEDLKSLNGLPFLSKPFETDQLLRTVRKVMDETE